jgi:hypothetical protein
MNKWVWLWGFIPVYVRYVAFIEKRQFSDGTEGEVAGRAHWVWCEILADEKDNAGLLAHELTHCKQSWKLPFIHKPLRGLSLRYRAWAEASAYAAQLMTYGWSDQYREQRLDAYAYLIANAYGLSITQAAAREMLIEEIRG